MNIWTIIVLHNVDTLKFFLIYISFLNIYLQQASVLVEMWSLFSFALSNLQLSLVLIYDIYTVYDIRYTISSSTSFSNKSPALSFCAIFAFHIFVLVYIIHSQSNTKAWFLFVTEMWWNLWKASIESSWL